MSDDQATIQQLLHANEQLNRELGTRRQNDVFPRRLCQLGAALKKQEDGTPNTLADDCFTAAMEFVSMSRIAKHCQASERQARLALQKIADVLDTTVNDLPKVALELNNKSRKRDFSPHELLGMDSRTSNMILLAANTYGRTTLGSVADLTDDNFLALRHCGPDTLRKIRTAFSFGDADEL